MITNSDTNLRPYFWQKEMLRRDSFFLSIVEEEFQHQVLQSVVNDRFPNLDMTLISLHQIEKNVVQQWKKVSGVEAKGTPKTTVTTTSKTTEVQGNLLQVN